MIAFVCDTATLAMFLLIHSFFAIVDGSKWGAILRETACNKGERSTDIYAMYAHYNLFTATKQN